MTLTNVWAFNLEVDSTANASQPGQLLNIGTHKLLVGKAYLSSKGDHQVEGGAAAAVGFTHFFVSGLPFPIPFNPNQPQVQQGEFRLENQNISQVNWDLSVTGCHARAAVVIEAYD